MEAVFETGGCLSPTLARKFSDLWLLVGNTPMLAISYRYKGLPGTIYAKCEQFNLTGSMKDRMALYILQQAYLENSIKAGDRIVEATSGSSGISFSAIAKALGHPVTIFMPDWVSQERIDIIRSLGAIVVPVSREQGGFLKGIALTKELTSDNTFLPCQFENDCNTKAHSYTTGPEIIKQLKSIGLQADAFVAGVGTGGTVMGVGECLKSTNGAVKIHPLEPAESPTLSMGYKSGFHRIQGLTDEFIPKILKLDLLDSIVQAHDGDAIIMAQKIAAELGLAVGISSGANIVGAILLKEAMGKNATVVTVLPDCNKKYLSTDLVRKEPMKEGYCASEVQFTGYTTISRLPSEEIYSFG